MVRTVKQKTATATSLVEEIKMSKHKPDWAERVARKLVTLEDRVLRVAGWVLREGEGSPPLQTIRSWFLRDFVSALRKAGVK